MKTKELCDAEFKKKKIFVIKDEKSIPLQNIMLLLISDSVVAKWLFSAPPPPRVEKDYFKQTHKMCVTSEASELYI